MNSKIYIEGGGDSKDLHVRCRSAFRALLEACKFEGRMPRLVASGSRRNTYEDFVTAHRRNTSGTFVAMLVDSESPVSDIDLTWDHLHQRDHWPRPEGADDEQVLLMVTCMETWIVADPETLRSHYGSNLQESALPPPDGLEAREPAEVQDALVHASRDCRNAYKKGRRAFEIVAKLEPAALEACLPSFARMKRVLGQRLRE